MSLCFLYLPGPERVLPGLELLRGDVTPVQKISGEFNPTLSLVIVSLQKLTVTHDRSHLPKSVELFHRSGLSHGLVCYLHSRGNVEATLFVTYPIVSIKKGHSKCPCVSYT